MKLIKKYQGGGGISYRPLPFLQGAQQEPSPQSQQQQQQEVGIDKDITKELLGKGVTNDIIAYSDMVNNAYTEYSTLDPIMRNSAYGRKLRNIMKGDIGTLGMLVRNKELLDTAAQQAVSNKAMDEVAITSFGVVVQDLESGHLKEVSHEDFANIINSKDKKYRALTNAELLTQREYNKNLVGDVTSINALNSSIGMPVVKDEIWKVLQYVESNKTENKQAASMAKALSDAKENANKGIFDVEQMEVIESNKQQLEQAIESTWVNLSENSKSLLKTRAAMMGATGSQIDKVAKEFMISLLSPKQSTKIEKSTREKFDSGATKFAFGEGTQALDDMKYYQRFADLKGTAGKFTANTGGGYQITTTAMYQPAFKKSDGSDYGIKAMSKMPELSNVLDLDSVYIGNQKIDRMNLNSLIYGGGKIAQVELPYIEYKGKKRVDLDMADKLGKAEEQISKLGRNASVTAKEQIYDRYGVPTDGRGNKVVPLAVFATFTGYINKGATDDPDDDKSLLELGDTARTQYESAYFEGANKEEKKNLDSQYKKTIYQGSVYIPVSGSSVMGRLTDRSAVSIPKETTTSEFFDKNDRYIDKTSTYNPRSYGLNSL